MVANGLLFSNLFEMNSYYAYTRDIRMTDNACVSGRRCMSEGVK